MKKKTNEDYILLEQNKFNSIIKTIYALKLQVKQLESKLKNVVLIQEEQADNTNRKVFK